MHSYIAVCGRRAVVGGRRGTGARQMTESFIAGEPGTAACRVRSGPPAVSVPTAHTRTRAPQNCTRIWARNRGFLPLLFYPSKSLNDSGTSQ